MKTAAAAGGDGVAIVDGEVRCTFAELDVQVGHLADELRARGLRRGDRVGILGGKSLAQVVAILAAARAQGVFVVISPKLKAEQADFICQDCRVRALIDTHARPVGVKMIDPGPICGDTSAPVSSCDVSGWNHPQADAWGWHLNNGPTIRRDLACLMYTSGSTGRPKGVMISHGNLLAGVESVVSYLGLRQDDRIVSVLPFAFDYGLNQLLCALSVRCRLILIDSPFPQDIARGIHAHCGTVLAGVPPTWALMLFSKSVKRGVGSKALFPSLRIVTNSGGRVAPAMLREMQRAFPAARIFLMYGLTEAFRSTYLDPDQLDVRPESIGKAIPGAEVFLVNDRGQPAQVGEIGEIVHRGDTVALGYWNHPDETARVYRLHPFAGEGAGLAEYVVYSGDYAVQDEEGFLYYHGRRDHQMKVQGMRVGPEEIEMVIAEAEGVCECVVVSSGSDDSGDRIVAMVLARERVDAETILKHCHRRLPRYMVPREVRLCESFPRLDNGKTDRMTLRDQARREMAVRE
ncbi:MAG: AMP-binding protein [Phycisphaerae bacterium]